MVNAAGDLGLNIENRALEKAYAASSLVEQLELLQRDLIDLTNEVPLVNRVACDLVKTRVTSLLASIDDGSIEIPTAEVKKLTEIGRSKIERLKLGAEIIRLRRSENLTYAQIAQRLELSTSVIKQFCNSYDQMSPLEKTRIERSSVFDTVHQLEDLSAIIYRQLARLEYNDPENHVRYISELRQCIKQAQDVANAISHQRQREQLKEAIVAILQELEPSKAEIFISRMRNLGLNVATRQTNYKTIEATAAT